MRTVYVIGFLALSLLVSSCAVQSLQVSQRKSNFEIIDSFQSVDPQMNQMLQPYRQHMDSAMNIVIGHLAVPMSKAKPECTMGNFMADAQLVAARKYNPKTQVSVMNYGGIRIPYVSPGELTKGKIYEIMPFDNKLVILDVPGKVLRQLCDHIAAVGGWPVAGMQFQIKDDIAINILVAEQPLNDQVMYTLALSDYIANGGDRSDFLRGNRRRDYNVFIRDILIDYITELNEAGKSLSPKLENRISYAE